MSLDVTLLLPLLEVSQGGQLGWVLHPLDDLQHGDEVDIVSVQHLFNELDQLILELFLALQPGSVEVKTKWGSVGTEMSVEVVSQESAKLFTSLDVGTRVNHVTTWQRLVERGIISSVQFVHDHFPRGVTLTWTIVSVSVTLVRHSEVECVWPDRNSTQGGSDGGIVHEELISHHGDRKSVV